MKNFLKQSAIIAGLETISRFRLERLFPAAGGRGLIFTLHHVRPKVQTGFDPNVHLEVTPKFLESTVEAALEAGLVPVRLDDLPRLLADPRDKRRYVAFTLDDGYRNNELFAAPIFRRHNIPYTIFITPGFVDRSTTMWWETLALLVQTTDEFTYDFGGGEEKVRAETYREKVLAFNRVCQVVNYGNQDVATERLNRAAADAGIDAMGIVDREIMTEAELRALSSDPLVSFGGHTMTHPVLSRVSPERLSDEIGRSMKIVSGYAGRDVTTFAYPYGIACAIGEREFAAAAAAGISLAVTTRPGMLSADTMKHPMAVNRVSLNGLYQKKHYVRALISGLPFKIKS